MTAEISGMPPHRRHSASALLALLDTLDTGVLSVDARHRIRNWNAWMERTTGHRTEDVFGSDLFALFPGLRDSRLHEAVSAALDMGACAVLSHALNGPLLPLCRADGKPLIHNAVVHRYEGDGEALCLIQLSDVTAEWERSHALRQRSDARYRAVVDSAADAIVTTDVAGTIQWINPAAESVFGFTQADAVGQPISLLVGDASSQWRSLADRPCSPRGGRTFDARACRRDGSSVELEVAAALWDAEARSLITGILRDVTERKRTERALADALAHKDLLMKEVNHRVKNSLQLAASLLLLQMRDLPEERLRAPLADAVSRIHAIAQLHRRLYETSEVVTVDLAKYLAGLCEDVAGSAACRDTCTVRHDLATIEVPTDQAISLGLIVNELLTNAIKHRRGAALHVSVSLERQQGEMHLTVADDGPGLPEGFDLSKPRSMGFRLITMLAAQSRAKIEVLPTLQGTAFRIVVPRSAEGPSEMAPSEDVCLG